MKLYPVNMKIDTNMDADDFGQRIVDCCKELDPAHDVVNLIKVKFKNDVPATHVSTIMGEIVTSLRELELTNCLCVPVGVCGIENLHIEYLKVDHVTEKH